MNIIYSDSEYPLKQMKQIYLFLNILIRIFFFLKRYILPQCVFLKNELLNFIKFPESSRYFTHRRDVFHLNIQISLIKEKHCKVHAHGQIDFSA